MWYNRGIDWFVGWDRKSRNSSRIDIRKGITVDTLIELATSHPVLTVALILVGLAVLLVAVFTLGYRLGIAKARELVEWLVYLQKDRDHRKVIRMQAVKPARRFTNNPYGFGCTSYPQNKTRKNIAKYRRTKSKF